MQQRITIDKCGAARSTKSPKGHLSSMSVQDMIEYLTNHGVKGVSALKRSELCEKIISLHKESNKKTSPKKLKVQTKQKPDTTLIVPLQKVKVQIKQKSKKDEPHESEKSEDSDTKTTSPKKLKVQTKQKSNTTSKAVVPLPKKNAQMNKPTLHSSVSQLLQYLQSQDMKDLDAIRLRNVVTTHHGVSQGTSPIRVPSSPKNLSSKSSPTRIKCVSATHQGVSRGTSPIHVPSSPKSHSPNSSSTKQISPTRTKYSPRDFHPKYDGSNSCYIDSTIVALLHTKTEWTDKNILTKTSMHAKHPQLHAVALKIQKELRDISSSLTPSCSQLRGHFKEYADTSRDVLHTSLHDVEWLRTQQEPTDVVTALSHVFDIKDDVIVSVNGHKRTQPFSSPSLQPFDLINKEEVHLTDFFPKHASVTTLIYRSAKFLCFSINRNANAGRKLTTKVVFPETIHGTDDPCCLQLRSIIVHQGASANHGHYICYIKRGDSWYMYNDMATQMKHITSSFSELLLMNDSYICKNCVMLVYS